MSTAGMDAPTHAVIHPTADFPAARLGKFDQALIPLNKTRFVPLTSMMIVIEGMGYYAHPTGIRTTVAGKQCIVYHVSPIPVQVAQ